MIKYIQLLRSLQWIKNTFVFAPIFFSNNLLKAEYLWPTLIVFIAFCLISSSIYCFNDLKDIEADRQHPQKCKRPIASGALGVSRITSLSAEHDCLQSQWQSYEIICQGSFYPVLHRWLDYFIFHHNIPVVICLGRNMVCLLRHTLHHRRVRTASPCST